MTAGPLQFNFADAAEADGALEVQRRFPRFVGAPAYDAQGNFGIGGNGIRLMPCFGTVELQLATGMQRIDGKRIGIATLPMYSRGAAGFVDRNFNTRLPGQCPGRPSRCSEQGNPLHRLLRFVYHNRAPGKMRAKRL